MVKFVIIFINSDRKQWGLPGASLLKNLPAKAKTWVWSLIWKDPTCLGAAKSSLHHCIPTSKAYNLQPVLPNESHHIEKPVYTAARENPCSPQLEKRLGNHEDPAQRKNKLIISLNLNKTKQKNSSEHFFVFYVICKK